MFTVAAHPQGIEVQAPSCSSEECRGYVEPTRTWVVGVFAGCSVCAVREAGEVIVRRLSGDHVTDRELDQALEVLNSVGAEARAVRHG